MKNLFNDLSESEKSRILEQHEGGKTLVIENFQKLLTNKLGSVRPLVMEQDDIVEKQTQELLGLGFKEVSEVNLPNGTYQMGGSGYVIDILSPDETDTGYRILSNQGIRGLYSGPIQIVNKKPIVDNINKIMFKDMGYKAVSQVKVTITPEMLINSSIPQEVVSAPAPRFTISGGQGNFYIKGSTDLYGVDLSKYLSDMNGEYYLFTETAEYLNQNKPNYGAKPKTQWVAFVNRATKSGKILYVGNKGLVTADFTA
jgi:hypothetical protein